MSVFKLSANNYLLKRLIYIIFLVLASTASLSANAQNDTLSNLFFTPVPLSQADLITLNNGGLSDADRQSAAEAIPRLQEEFNDMEAEDPGDPELLRQLNTLGLAQQAIDQHEEAITTFNSAAGLAVEIYGEGSLQQIPMLEQSILSHLKLNNISEITDIEEKIYQLKSSQFAADSAEMYSAMTNLADWYSSAYFKEGYLSQSPGFIPRVTSAQRVRRQTGINTTDVTGNSSLGTIADGSIRDVTINDVIDLRLRKLEDLYKDYQSSYSSNTSLATVVDVARRIARLAYHAEQEMDYERAVNVFYPNYSDSREQAVRNSEQRRDESYDAGKAALEYVVNLIQSAEGIGKQQLAIAMLDLADWELAYGSVATAQSTYRNTYQILHDDGFNDASIDAALTSAIPVAIPRIGAFPATRQTSGSLGLIQNPDYRGYIDVSFSIDAQGNTGDITFLDGSSEEIPRIQSILEIQLRITKFRPLLRAGELFAQEAVEYRYYYSY